MLVLLGGLIATAAVAFTRDNVTRRAQAPALRSGVSQGAADPRPVGRRHSCPSATRAGPPPGLGAAREEAGSSVGSRRGRSTLGSVPRADSASARRRADEIAQQAPQLRRGGDVRTPAELGAVDAR